MLLCKLRLRLTPWRTSFNFCRAFGSPGSPGPQRLSSVGDEELLIRLRQAAVDAGGDPLEIYQPWILMDSLQQSLMLLHQATGHAGLAVVLVALLTRLGTWPWNRRSLQCRFDAVHLMPIYQEIGQAIQDAQQRRGGRGSGGALGAQQAEADLENASKKLKEFTAETHFSPTGALGYQFGFVLPVGFVYFGALYGILEHPDPFRSFVTEKTLWLDSLVLPDPYGILPCMSVLCLLANAELNAEKGKEGEEERMEYLKLAVRGALLTFVPWTAGTLPAATFLYIATNGLYTAAATWLVRRYYWRPPVLSAKWKIGSFSRSQCRG
ncbi:Mitochondrial inner membrane protein OXA1 (Oxidase assembly 1 protein) (AtOXA1) [Durusdinium trenchii]|uniref:Mitochondrial inner membrane protein OXA1 (Oxidase assembly 1 protein) (AtOXA1) n=1 Tax=Durusdinium trenchii TaxID=1381693 RepID=A0ABP0LQ86_9DINO